MIKYKLTDQAMQTHGGFQWVLGKKEVITSPGATLCSDQVFHYYASPEQAVFSNPIHADIRSPRLFTAEIDKEVVFDGLKGGCHEMTLVKELTLPTITLNQRVEIAIRLALTRYHSPGFTDWANNWLSGVERSAKAAWAAEAACDATWAAAGAAWAAEAAEAAACEAAWAAVGAADAAGAAGAAAAAKAAWAAEAAAWAVRATIEISNVQLIIEEVLYK